MYKHLWFYFEQRENQKKSGEIIENELENKKKIYQKWNNMSQDQQEPYNQKFLQEKLWYFNQIENI